MNSVTYLRVKDHIQDVVVAAVVLRAVLDGHNSLTPRDVAEDELDAAIVAYARARKTLT